ncbi:hypothetical protein Tco_1091119 [Tanacetum coccineum]|uniref:Uncharacterized protein n=1 Tax=Tanacetum coccineum TaxID=301880 RepID=A0ABQ5I6B8_9ASTR
MRMVLLSRTKQGWLLKGSDKRKGLTMMKPLHLLQYLKPLGFFLHMMPLWVSCSLWPETSSYSMIKQDFKGISICQEKYVKDLLKKYNLADSASVKCLMLPPNNLGPNESGVSVNETLYQANPKESHLVVVKRIFSYIKGTLNLGLGYPKGPGFDLKAYSDSNYARCNLDRNGTLGGCQILSGKLVSWSAKKQSLVAMSSAKAEYVVPTGCCAHGSPTDTQLADIFTKPLAEPSFTRLVTELGMLNIEKEIPDKDRISRNGQNKDKHEQSRVRGWKEDKKLRPKAYPYFTDQPGPKIWYRISRNGQNKDKHGQSRARGWKEDEKPRLKAYPYSTD